MSILIGTATQAPISQQEMLLKDIKFPKGFRAERVRAKCTIPFKNNTMMAQALQYKDVIDALKVLYANNTITFGYGERPQYWKQGEDFNLGLREYGLAMEELDVQVIDENGNILDGGGLAASTAWVKAAVAPGVTYNVVCEVSLPFVFVRAKGDRHEWCPGSTQMRQMKWVAKRSAGFEVGAMVGAGFIEDTTSAMSVVFLADIIPGDDEWVMPPLLSRKPATTDLQTFGLGGRLLGIWDRTSTGAASTLGLMEIAGILDDESVHTLHDQVTAADIFRGTDRELESGARDLGVLAAVLFRTRQGTKIDDIPVARRWYVKQISQSPVQMDLVFLVAGFSDDAFVSSVAGHLTDPKGGNEDIVKLTTALAARREDAPPTSHSTAGLKIARKGGSDFDSLPGTVVTKLGGGDVALRLDLPAGENAKVQAKISIASGAGEQKSAAIKAISELSKKVPGNSAVTRSTTAHVNRSPTAQTLANLIPSARKLI